MLRRLVSLLSSRLATAGLLALAAALWLSSVGNPALARDGSIEVDVELVLAVDISYSMDPEEQALQRQGYVEALKSPVILDAIAKGVNGKIAITYVEWAGSGNQDVIVPWMVIDGMESAQEFTARLMAKPIRRLYRTSISGALDFSVQLFEANNYMGLKRVIDVSGDGSNNQGRPVTQARDDALAQGITINGLPLMLNRANFGYPEVEHSTSTTRTALSADRPRSRSPFASATSSSMPPAPRSCSRSRWARRRATPPLLFRHSSAQANF